MLTYILQTSICWLGFYLLYVLLLRKETFFRLNRWYLLGTLALGLLIPLVEWPSFAAEDNPAVVYLAPISVGVQQLEVTVTAVSEQPEAIDWMQVLTWLYWLGVAVFTVRFAVGLVQIFNLYNNGEKLRSGSLRLVYTEQYHLPFSFFNYVFWSRSFEAEHEDKLHILRHEEAHISGWHTLDVLLLELLGIFLWCSPMIYFYRASLKTIHEYLADAAVLQTTHRKRYGKLLLKQSMSGLQIALAHQFFHSQLKDRILMMTRAKSRKEAIVKYFLILPSFIVLTMLVAARTAWPQFDTERLKIELTEVFKGYETLDTPEKLAAYDKMYDIVYSYKDQYEEKAAEIDFTAYDVIKDLSPVQVSNRPWTEEELQKIKPEIELILSENVQLRLADKARGDFLMKHLTALTKRYIDARLDQKETIFALVEQVEAEQRNIHFDGDKVQQLLADALAKDILLLQEGSGLDFFWEVFRSNQERYSSRTPELREIAVQVAAQNDIQIGISKDGSSLTIYQPDLEKKIAAIQNKKDKYQMPIFSGCKDTICSSQKLMEFVYKNIKYPASARQGAVQGTVVIYYTIEETGEVTNVGVARSVSPELDEEVMRVVKEMPHWKPALKNGEPVPMTLTLPVRYKLEPGDESVFQSEREQYFSKLFEGELLHVIGYPAPQTSDEVFNVVEEMPRYPGCEDVEGTDLEKKKCADQKMLEFIYQNVSYPKAARKAGVEGVVVIQFIVDENGKLYDHKVVRQPSASLGAEALRVAKLMPHGWTPGVQRGRNVKVQFNLPIKFKLDDKEEPQILSKAPTAPDETEVFKVVEEMPRFPGCEEMEATVPDKKKCADKKMLEFIYKNLTYPEAARKAGVEGTSVVSFIVEKDGTLSDIEMYRSIGAGTDEELMRLMDMMPKWIPGKQRGRNVRVQFNLPVKFRLGTESTTQAEELKEELPRFPGCEDKGNSEKRQTCSNQELVKFISSNLKYPQEAKEKGVEGTVVLSFTVKKDGSLDDIKIAKGIGQGCDEEALRVAKLMPGWVPGTKNGQVADTDMFLPVKFSLGEATNVQQREAPRPYFADCESLNSAKASENCAMDKWKKYDLENTKFPFDFDSEAGSVQVQVIIAPSGEALEYKITKGIGEPYDSEALRLMKGIGKWIPQKVNGEYAETKYRKMFSFAVPNNFVPKPSGQELSLKNFSAAPNPTDSELNIRFQAEAKPITVTITDVAGKQLFRPEVQDFDGYYQKQLDVRQAAKGLLLITVQQEGKVFTQQVVVQ